MRKRRSACWCNNRDGVAVAAAATASSAAAAARGVCGCATETKAHLSRRRAADGVSVWVKGGWNITKAWKAAAQVALRVRVHNC